VGNGFGSAPMRVLIIASEYPPVVSGVARAVDRLVRGLREQGHEVDTLSSSDAPYLVAGEIRLSGLSGRLLRFAPEIARRYDLVNVHGPVPTISDFSLALLGIIRRHGRPRVLYTHHSTLEFDGGLLSGLGSAYTAGHRVLARQADHVVVTSETYADLFGEGGDPPVSVVPWGVDLDRFEPAATSGYDGLRPLRVLLVGQLRPYKGCAVAIDAVASQRNLALTIVGRGQQEAALARRVLKHRVANVRLVGYLPEKELLDAYREHDVCVLPSTNRQEAFGLVLLEGMAAGCVPVASDLPGVRDVAQPSGILVAPGDVQDLRWALNELAAQPEAVTRLQAGAINIAARRSWDHASAAYNDLIERLVRP
jgi:glycosyltransferase involved in cell wall biosynthesis